MTTFLSWTADDVTGIEGVRLLRGSGGLKALGRLVRADADEPFSASYRLVVAGDETVARLAITSATAQRERHLTMNRTEDGFWLLDTGTGGGRAEFDGAVDVDVAFSPLFSSVPVRRLGLHTGDGDHVLKVVCVQLPGLGVELVERRYRTVTPLDGDRAVVGLSTPGLEARIEFDADGFVTTYPGVARRLPIAAPAG